MRRLGVLVALCSFAGLATSVALAWLSAVLMRPSKWSPGVEPPWRDAVVGTIEVEQFVSRGATFRRLMVLPEDQIEPDEQSLPGSLPVWSLAFGERPAAHRADRLIGYEKSFGWPMRCLRTSWLIQEQSFALPGDGLRWGIRLKPVRWGLPDYSGMSIQPYMPYVETEEQRAFPLRPMLVGMALNTLIFGSGWFGVAWLVCLPGLLRIRWRRRQSRCVRCGYELDAAVTRCSECGHALSARLPVMARGAFVAVGLAGVLLLGGLAGLALWRTSGIRDVPPIHRAARDGDLATLEALADSGVDIDLVMPDGIEPLDFSLHRSTPLLLASAAGQNDAVSWLLGRGASPDGVSEWVAGPIGRASFRGHAEICRALLGAGASYGVDDAYGFAIAGRDLETIGVFRDHYGETAPSVALTSAVWHHPEVASELLGWHTWGDAAMASALDASIKTENVEFVRLLLTAGVGVVGNDRPWVWLAAEEGNAELVRLMLESGASANVRQSGFGGTPLRRSVISSCAPCFELILEAGGDPFITTIDGRGLLHLASGLERALPLVERLVGLGLDPDLADRDGRTPLIAAVAASRHEAELVTALLEAGAAANLADPEGRTPLDYALGGFVDPGSLSRSPLERAPEAVIDAITRAGGTRGARRQ